VKQQAGLWIDHRKAVIVIVAENDETVSEITADIVKHVRFAAGRASEDGSTSEDVRDRQFENRLNSFYDRVIAVVRGADAIQTFGPGEAKGELAKRLEHDGLKDRILAMETVDKMTDRLMAAKVRGHFLS
jgi:hypothetical protein